MEMPELKQSLSDVLKSIKNIALYKSHIQVLQDKIKAEQLIIDNLADDIVENNDRKLFPVSIKFDDATYFINVDYDDLEDKYTFQCKETTVL